MTSLPTDADITYQAGEPAGTWTDAVKQFYSFVKEGIGVSAASELTINDGSITPTQGNHTVDTEGDATSDDLANIATINIEDGRWLLLRAAANGRTVVVKHQAGGVGQISTATGADVSLDDVHDWIILERNGNDWRELMRASTVSGAVINEVQGADIASAATVNLTSATGNLIQVTGTTPITAITLGAGMERWVRFTEALTITNGANLVNLGATNIVTTAGDVACFRGFTGGVVRMMAFFRASSLPGFLGIAQTWNAPQRMGSSTAISLGNQSGNVDLAVQTFVDFDITQSAAITLINPTNIALAVGQRGTISIAGNAHGISGIGTFWKRVGDTGLPTLPTTGFLDIEYHIKSATVIRFSAAEREA